VTSSGVTDTHDEARVSGPGVVTGRYGTIGQVFYVATDFWPLNTTLFVKDFKGNDPLFVSYLLRTVDFASYSGKSGVPGVNRNDLHGLSVSIPSPTEQRTIAASLSGVDALIGALDKLIAKKRGMKLGAMQQLLTGKSRLPGFQAKWPDAVLGSVLQFQVGFPFSSGYFNTQQSGRRLVKNRDLKTDDELVYYTGPYDDQFLVKNGDLLVGMDGEFLPCLWNKGVALLTQRIGRIIPTDGFDPIFGFYFLRKPLKQIENATSSTTVKHLSHSAIERITVALPSIEEQRAIGLVLSDMDAEVAALERRRDKTKAIKQGMTQELLTGRTRLV